MIAWRHNVDDIRNIAFTIGAPGGQTFSEAQIATDTDWYFVGCPADGPRLTEFLDETIALVWSDKSTGSDEVWIQTSSDKGATWTNEVAVAPDYTESKGNPVVHQLLDGTVYVGLQSTSSMPVVTSAEGGQTWSAAAELITPDGPLDWIEFATGAGMSAVVGQTEAGTVWFKRLE